MAVHLDAQQRMDSGQKQRECPVCKDYIWENLFSDAKGGSNGSQDAHMPCADAPKTTPEPPG
jgi:hypothetical protein